MSCANSRFPRRPGSTFFRDEDGALLVWYLFTVVAIMLAVGLGLSVQRFELNRASLQNTLDRAVLAATDLDQTREAVAVIEDYVKRAGHEGSLTHADVETGVNFRTSTASAELTLQTISVPGDPTWDVGASAAAIESITDVEIALVLDNSGSMGWDQGATSGDGNYRLNLLKPAAKDFVEAVSRPKGTNLPGSVSVSIVPFSTQVNAGPDIAGQLNYTTQHDYSQCARFASDDFRTTAFSPTATVERAGHFDTFTWDSPVETEGVVCPFDESRHITAWSQDPDELKDQIDAMWAGGNTSIDVATKWGVAMLDPSFRPVLNAIGDANLHGQPFDYGRDNTLKVLVVMSDGQNTEEYRLRDEYRSGDSPLYRNPANGNYSYRHRHGYYGTIYYQFDGGFWSYNPDGGDDAVRMQWPEVFDAMSLRHYAYYIKQRALGGNWQNYYYDMRTYVDSGTKNWRASQICREAREAGIVVFTIGMDTYGQGDATLEDCAGSSTNFYDVESLEIAQAFSSIAQQINQLRLTY